MYKKKIQILVVGIAVLLASCAEKSSFDKEIEQFNYSVGTQTVGTKYKFTNETNLVETAKAIREMGSNVLKMSMGPRYWWENYDIPRDTTICSLVQLAQEKSMKEVLEMDFSYYQIWAYEFTQYTQEQEGVKRDESQIKYIDGWSEAAAALTYLEIYELAAYLLTTYSGTDKVFMLGNWEGDWHLRWDYDRTKDANPKTIEGMTWWLNVRQKAIDDAKRNIPHHGVKMYHYVELNLSDLAVEGKACVTNSILPNINPDYVSFSSYTATNPPATEAQLDSMLTAHLDYINSKIKPKEGLPSGRRLFVGEYGWHEQSYTRAQVNERAKWTIKSALKWGSPFILFWEMYNNELDADGHNRGFWLIDDKNQKTDLYYTHKNFLREGKSWVIDYSKRYGKMPSQQEYLMAAVEFEALK